MKKGKRDTYTQPFVPLGKEMLFKCLEWKEFSPAARDIYIMLKAKYNTKNNGEICLYYSELKKIKGLRNQRTISRGFKELEEQGWIERSPEGGLYKVPKKYKLTGKYDAHL